ncbi:carbonic anhydrase family protein [Aquimarina sp. 2201CG5-10]|uniref:carbonic anhydrase n=1 Tax=Aquimarina callyspongiae TaxID=3098150 RepID=UPI002AB37461|nr:carbonic anhydrase family protein [Aquimarina sp. 2201CG5-10]MDY8136149.1 carbonic anhydrase family protein [Aquimarina sp. 2201CG5-10]
MKTKVIIVGIVLTMISISCKHKQNSTETSNLQAQKSTDNKDHKTHWEYSGEVGPEHWAELIKDADCGGQHQSPINIVTIDVKKDSNLNPLDIQYSKETKIYEVINNGHSIQYNFEQGDYINYQGDRFDLKQIHFHESAEHTINGIRYPLAIHMVHTNKQGEYLVLAVMVKEGENSQPFEFLENYLPLKKGETKTINSAFDLTQNLPNNRGYYTYTGSLTTPPCTEDVYWFVFKEPITVSLKQVVILRDLMPLDNFRNEQPLNDRIVKMTAY